MIRIYFAKPAYGQHASYYNSQGRSSGQFADDAIGVGFWCFPRVDDAQAFVELSCPT